MSCVGEVRIVVLKLCMILEGLWLQRKLVSSCGNGIDWSRRLNEGRKTRKRCIAGIVETVIVDEIQGDGLQRIRKGVTLNDRTLRFSSESNGDGGESYVNLFVGSRVIIRDETAGVNEGVRVVVEVRLDLFMAFIEIGVVLVWDGIRKADMSCNGRKCFQVRAVVVKPEAISPCRLDRCLVLRRGCCTDIRFAKRRVASETPIFVVVLVVDVGGLLVVAEPDAIVWGHL